MVVEANNLRNFGETVWKLWFSLIPISWCFYVGGIFFQVSSYGENINWGWVKFISWGQMREVLWLRNGEDQVCIDAQSNGAQSKTLQILLSPSLYLFIISWAWIGAQANITNPIPLARWEDCDGGSLGGIIQCLWWISLHNWFQAVLLDERGSFWNDTDFFECCGGGRMIGGSWGSHRAAIWVR